MTVDVVALCARLPDAGTILGALLACAPQLHLDAQEPLMHLRTGDGALVLSIEAPREVPSAGEVQRLLGVPDAPQPCWWVEARAAVDPPDGVVLARRFAAALLSETGGTSWSSR